MEEAFIKVCFLLNFIEIQDFKLMSKDTIKHALRMNNYDPQKAKINLLTIQEERTILIQKEEQEKRIQEEKQKTIKVVSRHVKFVTVS